MLLREERRMRTSVTTLFIALMAFAPPLCAGPFEDGLAAYDQGNYEAAFKQWLPLAEHGSAAAQFNIAVMYEKAQGVLKDDEEAARWYRRAAQQRDIEARYRMGSMYEAGRGVEYSVGEARKWYLLVIGDPRNDAASMETKQRARQRLAALPHPEEFVNFKGGRFAIGAPQGGSCAIALQGSVTEDAVPTFLTVVEKSAAAGCVKPWIVLESPGGDLSAGIDLGKEVHKRGFSTASRFPCVSACSLIFMGGVERVLVGSRAKIGLHQPHLVWDKTCVTASFNAAIVDTKSYVRTVIPEKASQILDRMLGTPCNEVSWVQAKQAINLGIATRLESETVDVFGAAAARQPARASDEDNYWVNCVSKGKREWTDRQLCD
jgi:ATP-dependent protease ClpP protease subunit